MHKSFLLLLALDYLLLSIYETRSLLLDTIIIKPTTEESSSSATVSNLHSPVAIGGCCLALRMLRSTIFNTDKINVIAVYKLLAAVQLLRVLGYASMFDMLPEFGDVEYESGGGEEEKATTVNKDEEDDDGDIMKRYKNIILFKDVFMLVVLIFSIFWETSGNIRKVRKEKEVTRQQETIRYIQEKQIKAQQKGPAKKLKQRQRRRE